MLIFINAKWKPALPEQGLQKICISVKDIQVEILPRLPLCIIGKIIYYIAIFDFQEIIWNLYKKPGPF